nr:ribonuclease H-like domain-containing protein [Tanacetum cinerariifolium]
FCKDKGIKRELSVARTPHQNGVPKRRNRTLIEAARTMLVDSKLPTTFWAEAVNTACYVLNKALVTKPRNKTPYELIRGRPPLIDFMKPFGCPVTILNNMDNLGKYEGKANEGYFVRYSMVSKAMRVFNKRTRIVEETLNIRFQENAPNVKGNGPDWHFNIDSLTISMNYVLVVVGNQTNGITGSKEHLVAGQGSKDSTMNARKKAPGVDESEASINDRKNDQVSKSKVEGLPQQARQTKNINNYYTMVDVNVNAHAEQAPTMAPPTHTNDQILPHIRWVPLGKSNCYLDVERSQTNPIFKIAVDILKNTNFFRAFTASLTIPSIYIQQFWDTVRYDKIAGCYKFQLDNQWFDLTKDTLRDALLITPVDNNNAFSFLSTPDALINFVNHLGYPKVFRTLSDVVTNDMFQPWRALATIINLCLTGKTSGFERPRALVKHKFHPRPDSPLHLPNEEPSLGYLKFSAKGTKREVFGMPIPNELITADIQCEQYYKEYLEKVAKHQRYLVGEEGSDPDSPAPKPTKATKKSKPSAPKADLSPPVTKPASSQQPKPKPAPIKSQEKKYESTDEGIPENEPRFDDEEADIQRAVEENLKSVYDAPRGTLPPVVIREPDSRKFQPLPEVQGKGKEKVSDEQVAHDLLTLQTPKKVSPTEQYIFQRQSDEEVPHVVEVKAQDEGQAGSNSGVTTEGWAGSDPDDDAEPQPQSSHVIHARSNLKHMDLEATEVSTQLHPEQMNEGFIVTAYPNVQENLKLTVEEHTTIETEVESMVSITIQQDTSAIPPMTTPVINLTSRPDSPNAHRELQATTTETTTTITTTTHPPPPQPQQSTTDSMLIKRIDELEQIMAYLIQDNKHLEERLDSHGVRLYTLENLDIPQRVSKAVDEIVTDAVVFIPISSHGKGLVVHFIIHTLKAPGYGIYRLLDTAYRSLIFVVSYEVQAHIRRIFLMDTAY